MASLVPENWSYTNMGINDNFSESVGVASSNMSNALLMSLLEETQGGDQDHDEERLSSLIRALEVELEPTTGEGDEIFMDNLHEIGGINQEDHFQPFDVEYVDGRDFQATTAPGFGWMDMEKGSSSSQGTEESVDRYMDDSCFDDIDCMSSSGGSQYNGSIIPTTNITPCEEDGYQNLNYASMNDDNAYAFEVHEGMETNGAILMSLLEEWQEEARDEERLNSVIQSLEAEIIKTTMDSNDSSDPLRWFEMDQVACSPSNDMNWYVDSCEYDQMDNCPKDRCEWVRDYSHVYCNGVGIEEEHVYSSIWQETAYDSITYD
ncbi:hypothetical protein D8674_005126 [Pyrus ussuriensis x Pyrus communis]|uniref:Uncharacterized protein n=1 Tax=Pyrus ussuriensis x Pyrus communis TaxID=2448454 RepID=A0A5N5FQJ5_9ROSA|nr:hypothetical protein D8674_005126 [Pyrus ussuriensis x Pyrus communis]